MAGSTVNFTSSGYQLCQFPNDESTDVSRNLNLLAVQPPGDTASSEKLYFISELI